MLFRHGLWIVALVVALWAIVILALKRSKRTSVAIREWPLWNERQSQGRHFDSLPVWVGTDPRK
jgi:hypothetical protein